ncbi:ABC transporter substrate-binding protein [Bradyrhizobium sp. CCGUVB23]|uniref:ABC transporter substrate-binding protein n=1 Tax=Bradyrhizobium sp. CCGUVB23 TaxID=2949630 RepID=UPI0020B2D826|nr:ABC transporter substrate-binding protein [Bradyrhizobium sp. CCGUVB23]MCP3462620.1 ABC transporter substrate-binding protein [Bradyrhizobium sp. CCGUVB23]
MDISLRTLKLKWLGPLSAPLVAAVLLLGNLELAAAQTERLPKVGYLGFGAATPSTFFQKRMKELGWSEGKDVNIEYRFAGGRPGELPRLARELVNAKVDVIMASGDEAIVAAKNATRTIPIVMSACDAVTTGFVASLAHPGGNITGVTCITSELLPKRLAVFRELLPSASRLVVLYNPENVSKPPEAARAVELAKELYLDAKAVQFRTAEDIETAFSSFATDRPDGLVVLTEQRSIAYAKLLAELSRRERVPVLHSFSEGVYAGGLISYGPDLPEMAVLATNYVSKILKGGKPAELPVEQPTRFKLVINLKTAKEIGLTVPTSLIARADEVIE